MRLWSHTARVAGLAGAIGTALSLYLWATQSALGDMNDRLIMATLFSVPLAFAFAGLARHQIRTAGWSAMLAVLYMSHALAEYVMTGGSSGQWLTLFFSSLLFIGCTLYPRLRSREGSARRI